MSSISTMTMSNIGNTTTINSNQNQVPSDLIPTTRNKITLDYASYKMELACMLNPSKFPPLKRSQNDADFVAEWQFYMIKIQTELQQFGHNFAMKKLSVCMQIMRYLFLEQKNFQNPFMMF